MIMEAIERGDEARLLSMGFKDPARALNDMRLLSQRPLVKPHMGNICAFALDSASPSRALTGLERVFERLSDATLGPFLGKKDDLRSLVTILGASRFLTNMLIKDPSLLEWLFLEKNLHAEKTAKDMGDELANFCAHALDSSGMSRSLRLYKAREYLRMGSRDLLGLSSLEETVAGLSSLASTTLDSALSFTLRALKAAYGAPLYTAQDGSEKEAGLCVIGMGKLGAWELNFSSDIDLIYLYTTEKGETAGVQGRPGSSIPLHTFFTRAAETLTRLVSEITEHGFAFRVDLDLRPEGRGGQIVNSLRSMEIYYESFGRPWERAALIKARPVAGDMDLGKRFLDMVAPFVFRRYLDFTAIEEIKAMKESIDAGLLRRNPDAVDVKLGAGGIREIEFFCQALQLIHGGRDPGVRERGTLGALKRLCEKGFVSERDAAVMADAYRFLRTVEHRLQIVDARQTHVVPRKTEEIDLLARMTGFGSAEGFWEAYIARTEAVYDIYRSLFYTPSEEVVKVVSPDVLFVLSEDALEDEAIQRLRAMGFKRPDQAMAMIRVLKDAPSRSRFSSVVASLFERLLPFILSRVAGSADPDRALGFLERFLSAIGAKKTFYSLLIENPKVTGLLVDVFGASVFLSRGLIEQPANLDLLLSPELSRPHKTAGDLSQGLKDALAGLEDYEDVLDGLRRFRNLEVFRIAMNDIHGGLDVAGVSQEMTTVAEALIRAALEVSFRETSRRYGLPSGMENPGFAVIGLGKLGGRELIYGSDLDMVFVFADDLEGGETDGQRVVSNHEFFIKLGQRIITTLSLRTKEGVAFDVDMRLRPSGSSGPLVISEAALLGHHRKKTEAWERQAFIKARAVAGDAAFGERLLRELGDVIYSRPLAKEDVAELLRIRKRMELELAKETRTRYNIKTGMGGLVDVEFLVQTLQLRHGKNNNDLRTPFTVHALDMLRREGLVSEADHAFLKEARAFLRRLEMGLRIVHDRPEGYIEAGTEELSSLARRMGYDAGERLLAEYLGYRERVREIYLKTLGSLGEEG